MKTDEIKLRLGKFIEQTIDLYMPPTNFVDKLKNSTAKLWLDQNMWKLYKAVDAFGDEHHEIDIDKVIERYEDVLFEHGELRLDVKSMLPDNMQWLNDFLPNKLILFKKEDLYNMFK